MCLNEGMNEYDLLVLFKAQMAVVDPKCKNGCLYEGEGVSCSAGGGLQRYRLEDGFTWMQPEL